jgi:hypothetical protein
MAVFLEISVFGQGTLVLLLRNGGFLIVYIPQIFEVGKEIIYPIRAVLALLCGIHPFQLFTVLIAVTLV